MAKPNLLLAPIPGMSLTTEPGARPWEQPPQLVKLAEVVDFYTEKFTNPEFIDDMLEAIKNDAPLYETARGLILMNAMKGIHSIDTAMLVMPVVVEMMKTIAELNDVGYVIEQADKEKMTSVDRRAAEAAIKQVKETEQQRTEEPEEELMPKGLMARGA
jgi:hypothetical protein